MWIDDLNPEINENMKGLEVLNANVHACCAWEESQNMIECDKPDVN